MGDRELDPADPGTTSQDWIAAGSQSDFEGRFSPSLTMALFSPLFGQPQLDWPPNSVITGFPFYREPAALDAELLRFLDDGEPPIVFTLGSSASVAPGEFFGESLQAIRRLSCRAVLIVGEFAPKALPQPLPPNVAVFSYAPIRSCFPAQLSTYIKAGLEPPPRRSALDIGCWWCHSPSINLTTLLALLALASRAA